MRIAVETELPCNVSGKAFEDGKVFRCNVRLDKSNLCFCIVKSTWLTSGSVSENFVEFSDKALNGWYKFYKSFRNEYSSEVASLCCTPCDNVCNIVNNIIKTHGFLLDFLADKADVWLCLQCAFQCYVAGTTPHKLNEMPVFTC